MLEIIWNVSSHIIIKGYKFSISVKGAKEPFAMIVETKNQR